MALSIRNFIRLARAPVRLGACPLSENFSRLRDQLCQSHKPRVITVDFFVCPGDTVDKIVGAYSCGSWLDANFDQPSSRSLADGALADDDAVVRRLVSQEVFFNQCRHRLRFRTLRCVSCRANHMLAPSRQRKCRTRSRPLDRGPDRLFVTGGSPPKAAIDTSSPPQPRIDADPCWTIG